MLEPSVIFSRGEPPLPADGYEPSSQAYPDYNPQSQAFVGFASPYQQSHEPFGEIRIPDRTIPMREDTFNPCVGIESSRGIRLPDRTIPMRRRPMSPKSLLMFCCCCCCATLPPVIFVIYKFWSQTMPSWKAHSK